LNIIQVKIASIPFLLRTWGFLSFSNLEANSYLFSALLLFYFYKNKNE